MNNIFKQIDEVKYIQIVTTQEQLAVASALYTYILRLHKKVSLVCLSKTIDTRYSFLPWFDKIRKVISPSAEFTLELALEPIFSTRELLKYFIRAEITLNSKMATALYMALLEETGNFKNSNVDGMTFAFANKLVSAGAEHLVCSQNFHRTTLAELRLKSLMFQNMSFAHSATEVVFYLCDNDFSASGATMFEAKKIAQEAFNLPYIQNVKIVYNQNKEIELGKK
jgi:phosphoesterase RecJ-like protein